MEKGKKNISWTDILNGNLIQAYSKQKTSANGKSAEWHLQKCHPKYKVDIKKEGRRNLKSN